ncbi:MAG TPA: response regulator transcription factor, partial [Gemmatimonadales bacterium]|nr:response regulator transcription factor [Gemmatimonadales bacterium]
MTSISMRGRMEPAPGPRWGAQAGPTPSGRSRLLLADDHDLLLEAFRRLLEPEFAVLRGVTDGEALVEAALQLQPDAVVCDIAMPRLSGLQAARRVHERRPGIRFIFLTMYNDPELAAEAFRAGASAYVLKSSPARELLVAIRTALLGERYLPRLAPNSETDLTAR